MKEKEYTLKDAVKMFYKNENILSVQCIRNEKDITDEILEIDMGEGNKFAVKFEHFMFVVQKLDFYTINILTNKKGKPCGFEFSPNRREFYSFEFKV